MILRVVADLSAPGPWLSTTTAHVVLITNASDMRDALGALEYNAKSGESSQGQRGQQQRLRVTFKPLDLGAPFISYRAIARALTSDNSGALCLHLTHVPEQHLEALLNMIAKHSYDFDKYRAEKHAKKRALYIYSAQERAGALIRTIIARNLSADIARDLENEPANQLTPERFCAEAARILRRSKPDGGGAGRLRFRVLDARRMEKEGMGLVLSVGQSSAFPPRFLVVEHAPKKSTKDARRPTVCLIGKGVTFDAGGLRIKPPQAMMDMKQDKSGAAVVIAIMHYLVTRGRAGDDLGFDVVGLMPLVENVLGGRATKPGDIVRAHNGTNVEIVDPDAEGRLIIADAISYAERHYKPDLIIDFATLTSFASSVCCDLAAVYYTLDDAMASSIESLGESTGERMWRLPAWPEYKVHTTSPVAHTRNANFECTKSGSFMAAMFISNFVPARLARKWVHFDIANNDVRGIHTGNCAILGMHLLELLARDGF